MLEQGVSLSDGLSSLSLKQDAERSQWQVTMHEGRNRQIRRTFEALGYTVARLHRVEFGNYSLGALKPGEWSVVESP